MIPGAGQILKSWRRSEKDGSQKLTLNNNNDDNKLSDIAKINYCVNQRVLYYLENNNNKNTLTFTKDFKMRSKFEKLKHFELTLNQELLNWLLNQKLLN